MRAFFSEDGKIGCDTFSCSIEDLGLEASMEYFEILIIKHALATSGDNVTKAAMILKMNRTTLQMKIKKLGITREKGIENASGS